MIILFATMVFGQDKTLKQPFKSKPISDVFTRDAVTPQEMTERAKYHPYMKGEIVVAMEVNESKAAASTLVQSYEWSQLFGEHEVQPLAYLMTKELRSGLSVSLVHIIVT